MEYIDAHVHVWTDDFDRYPLAQSYTKNDMKPETFYPEELFAHARPGIRRQPDRADSDELLRV